MNELDFNNIVDIKKLRQRVFDYVKLRLADQIVDVEVDEAHLMNNLTRSIEVFRTRSSAGVEESMSFLRLEQNQQVYTLPEEVDFVKQIYRRTIGMIGEGEGSLFEPFNAGVISASLLDNGRVGGLLSFELFSQYQELTARMFGGYIDFQFNSVTKKLTIVRRPFGSGEIILLQTYNLKPECQLLTDFRTLNFIKEHTLALTMDTLGQARGKFSQIPGPGGGASLNGEGLKAQAKEIMDKLYENIINYHYGEQPLALLIG
jgi:hypothetical protein